MSQKEKINELFQQVNSTLKDKKYQKAISLLNEINEIDPTNDLGWFHLGCIHGELKENENAINAYKQALRINPNDNKSWNNLGNIYIREKHYDLASEAFHKALEMDSRDDKALYNLGRIFSEVQNYELAIEFYKKALDVNPKDEKTLNNLGYAYNKLGKHEIAIKTWEEGLNINDSYDKILYNLGLYYFDLGDDLKAIESFRKAKQTILSVYNTLTNTRTNKKKKDAFIKKMIEYFPDPLFESIQEVHELNKLDINVKKNCIDLYYKSIEIMANLHINPDKDKNGNENFFAHYTRKQTAHTLLFEQELENQKKKDIPFRLGTIVKANDPRESLTLFDFLDLKKLNMGDSEYQGFLGCFTFNHDSLNQFRLYGKENGLEATGLSIVFCNDFFNRQASLDDFKLSSKKNNLSLINNPDNESNTEDRKKDQSDTDLSKLPLYRCVYVDPITKQVISVGQREEYTFYRELLKDGIELEKIKSQYKEYKEYISIIIKKVNKHLIELQKEVKKAQEKDIDSRLLADLLIYLRYLVKHVAFKEEQECRIFQIENLANNKKITYKDGHMFVDYLPVKGYIEKIYFGPKATEYQLYKDLAKHKNHQKISFRKSTNPIS